MQNITELLTIDIHSLSLVIGGQQAGAAPIMAPVDRPSIPNTTTLQPFGPDATLGAQHPGNGPSLGSGLGGGGGGISNPSDVSQALLM